MSIDDLRTLRFDLVAVADMIERSPLAAASIGLPGRRPDQVTLDPRTQRVVCHYTGRASAAVEADRLAALLITYCIRAHIRVPRRTSRTVRIEQDAVAVSFSVSYDKTPVATSPEGESPPGRRGAALAGCHATGPSRMTW
jgi:hypothetical protein